jgi:hypothetical protein
MSYRAAGQTGPTTPGSATMEWDEVAKRFTDPGPTGLLLDELKLGGWVAICPY